MPQIVRHNPRLVTTAFLRPYHRIILPRPFPYLSRLQHKHRCHLNPQYPLSLNGCYPSSVSSIRPYRPYRYSSSNASQLRVLSSFNHFSATTRIPTSAALDSVLVSRPLSSDNDGALLLRSAAAVISSPQYQTNSPVAVGSAILISTSATQLQT